MSKPALRREVLSRRDSLSKETRAAASRKIFQRICESDAYRKAGTVLGYCSFSSELQTDSFLRAILEAGKSLALPRVNREREALDLYWVRDLEGDLEAGVWGIREPRTDLEPAGLTQIDLALVPGVVFDRRGGRLGYGGGFYDRLMGDPVERPLLVAGAFEVQIWGEVPVHQHDVLVELIFIEHGSYPRKEERSQ